MIISSGFQGDKKVKVGILFIPLPPKNKIVFFPAWCLLIQALIFARNFLVQDYASVYSTEV
jgi:hypothetical protein